MTNPYLDKYFVFSVNCPWTKAIQCEDMDLKSCLLYQNKDNLLIPVDDDTKRWHLVQTEYLPYFDQTLKEIIKRGIDEVFTTSIIHYPNTTLWGLRNIYAPKDWDYDKDPYPEAEIYSSLKHSHEFEKKGISVKEVKIPLEYL